MSKKIDLSLFRGDDSDDEVDVIPVKGRPVELDALKSKTFAHGVTKKTKQDIQREEEERKRAEEEAATQRALEEFSRSFDGPSTGPQGHASRGGRGGGRRAFVRAGEAPTRPLVPDVAPTPAYERPTESVRLPSPPPPPRPRGKRAMDAFLEEIKRKQEAIDARVGRVTQSEALSVSTLAGRVEQSRTFDGGRHLPQEATNLCVSNLPPNVNEKQLGQLFAQLGPVATIKIMWPRVETDQHMPDRFRPGLTGFVAYMSRKDAEDALARFEGYTLNGNRLRVSWSKPVSLPSQPAYGSLNPESRRPHVNPHSTHSRSRSPPRAKSNRDQADATRDYWLDQVPAEETKFIQEVSKRIRDHGPGLIETLKERESANPKFNFLLDEKAAAFHAFQYFLDRRYTFPDPPPPSFNDEGYASAYSSDSDERAEFEATSKVAIGKLAQRRLEAMLRSMTGKRVEIARAMEFAVKRADVSDKISEIICLSLCVEDTPVPRKIARLHLVSDILHNSSCTLPNVWRYRQTFERRLPPVFEHFATIHNRLLEYSSTLSANVFLQQIDAVLDIWEGWMVLTADIQSQLRRLLHGECTLASLADPDTSGNEPEPEAEPTFKSAGFKSSFKPVSASLPAESKSPSTPAATALDRTKVHDLDGEPVDDLDGEPVDDVDGEAMMDLDVDGDDMDGEAMDDVDGDPLHEDVDVVVADS